MSQQEVYGANTTPLIAAVNVSNSKCVKWLIENGAEGYLKGLSNEELEMHLNYKVEFTPQIIGGS